MTVSARPAKDPSPTASFAVDMRGGAPVRAGSYAYEGRDVVTGWHTHDLHQIEYAFEGIAEVETAQAHYVVPPQQAVWIPAGLAHCTTVRRVRSVAVFLDPAMVRGAGDRVRILAVTPLVREMLVYAVRWPIDRAASDPVADAFFDALALLAIEWLEHEAPLCLPTSTDPLARAVMQYTNDHLADATAAGVGAAVGVSERSLRRRFAAATGISWRQYLLQSRLLRAMALLTETRHTVIDVATQVGFDSASAFARSFAKLTGETPTAYRRRVRSDRPD